MDRMLGFDPSDASSNLAMPTSKHQIIPGVVPGVYVVNGQHVSL